MMSELFEAQHGSSQVCRGAAITKPRFDAYAFEGLRDH
jgi:hypothetical protein